jgi:UDP-N-acetylmuramoyl-L-alanyl-D-glutamate--2,6-diaminopimelate ligase
MMRSREMPLSQLLEGLAEVSSMLDVNVGGLTSDTRDIQRGDLFVALSGAQSHGLQFAEKALAQGASAIAYEAPAPINMQIPTKAIAVVDLREHLAAMANRFYGEPSKAMRMTGVTGTNGKTTTVQLIAQALSDNGIVCGTIGTLGAGLHGHIKAHDRTTPDVLRVHRLIADMHDEGAQAVAMEVTSHALDQGRVEGVNFEIAVFTNLTRDHLDYHGSMEAYAAAKAKLFAWPSLRCAVINIDDAFGAELAAQLEGQLQVIRLSASGNASAEVHASAIDLCSHGIRFQLHAPNGDVAIAARLFGRFNVDNLLAVAGVMHAMQWPLDKIASTLMALEPIGGRMSRVGGENNLPLVVVDYAHTPDALEKALSTLREHSPRELVCVFGCGGDRDRGKRPQMAAIAEKLSSRVIVTDDNPRTENGDDIVEDILRGFVKPQAVRILRNREFAIAEAIAHAKSDDIILVAGKGHETYQETNGVKHAFDDMQVARHYLGQRA